MADGVEKPGQNLIDRRPSILQLARVGGRSLLPCDRSAIRIVSWFTLNRSATCDSDNPDSYSRTASRTCSGVSGCRRTTTLFARRMPRMVDLATPYSSARVVEVSPDSYRSTTATRASSLSFVHFRRGAGGSRKVRTSAESRRIRRSAAVSTPVGEFVEQR